MPRVAPRRWRRSRFGRMNVMSLSKVGVASLPDSTGAGAASSTPARRTMMRFPQGFPRRFSVCYIFYTMHISTRNGKTAFDVPNREPGDRTAQSLGENPAALIAAETSRTRCGIYRDGVPGCRYHCSQIEETAMTVITNIEDLRVLAQKRVPRMFYDYADSGSWTESTYRSNAADFQKILLRQRVAINMEGRSTRTKMLGVDAAMPVAIAPTGLTGMQHADGEILAARAAEKFGIPFTLSTMSICSIEDIAAHTKAPFWFQPYMLRDRAFMERLFERAKAAKCSALVLTLDLQILGQRHKDLKNGLTAPPKPTLANLLNLATKPRWCWHMLQTKRRSFGNIVGHAQGVDDPSSLFEWTAQQFDPSLSWRDVEWVKSRWGGPLVLKGILDVEDARLAVASGA